jgi:hypothetical protein
VRLSPGAATLLFMRRLLLLLPLLAFTAGAQIMLDQTSIVTFTDCASGGSAAQALARGTYLMTVTGEDTWLCLAESGATCASGGTKYGAPFAMLIAINGSQLSAACRSSSSTGDIQFTRKGN